MFLARDSIHKEFGIFPDISLNLILGNLIIFFYPIWMQTLTAIGLQHFQRTYRTYLKHMVFTALTGIGSQT